MNKIVQQIPNIPISFSTIIKKSTVNQGRISLDQNLKKSIIQQRKNKNFNQVIQTVSKFTNCNQLSVQRFLKTIVPSTNNEKIYKSANDLFKRETITNNLQQNNDLKINRKIFAFKMSCQVGKIHQNGIPKKQKLSSKLNELKSVQILKQLPNKKSKDGNKEPFIHFLFNIENHQDEYQQNIKRKLSKFRIVQKEDTEQRQIKMQPTSQSKRIKSHKCTKYDKFSSKQQKNIGNIKLKDPKIQHKKNKKLTQKAIFRNPKNIHKIENNFNHVQQHNIAAFQALQPYLEAHHLHTNPNGKINQNKFQISNKIYKFITKKKSNSTQSEVKYLNQPIKNVCGWEAYDDHQSHQF